MSPSQLAAMQATGVAPLNADQNAANAITRGAAQAPTSSLYGQASKTLSNQMANPYGNAGAVTEGYLTHAASGKYKTADNNPYLASMAEAAESPHGGGLVGQRDAGVDRAVQQFGPLRLGGA